MSWNSHINRKSLYRKNNKSNATNVWDNYHIAVTQGQYKNVDECGQCNQSCNHDELQRSAITNNYLPTISSPLVFFVQTQKAPSKLSKMPATPIMIPNTLPKKQRIAPAYVC